MAERIDNLTPFRGRPPVYPWSEWMDGSAWRIRHGVDFDASPSSMASMVRLRAKAEGMTATARVTGDVVEFQFYDEQEAA